MPVGAPGKVCKTHAVAQIRSGGASLCRLLPPIAPLLGAKAFARCIHHNGLRFPAEFCRPSLGCSFFSENKPFTFSARIGCGQKMQPIM
jgi:hypothetical protein